MILRRFSESLKEQNWTAILIEFVLLVVGVFLGIQVSNWNEARIGQARTKQAALDAAHLAVDRIPVSRDLMMGAYNLDRLARTEARVGESDAAIDHLRQLLDAPAGSVVAVPILRIDPAWNPLRKDPRFQKLITDGGAAGQSPMP